MSLNLQLLSNGALEVCEGVRVSICISLQKGKHADHELAKPGLCVVFADVCFSCCPIHKESGAAPGFIII